jgi:hypothetical protein
MNSQLISDTPDANFDSTEVIAEPNPYVNPSEIFADPNRVAHVNPPAVPNGNPLQPGAAPPFRNGSFDFRPQDERSSGSHSEEITTSGSGTDSGTPEKVPRVSNRII